MSWFWSFYLVLQVLQWWVIQDNNPSVGLQSEQAYKILKQDFQNTSALQGLYLLWKRHEKDEYTANTS